MGEGTKIAKSVTQQNLDRSLERADAYKFDLTMDIGVFQSDSADSTYNGVNWMAVDVAQGNIARLTKNNSFGINFKIGKYDIYKSGSEKSAMGPFVAGGIFHEYNIFDAKYMEGSIKSSMQAVLTGGVIASTGVLSKIGWFTVGAFGIVAYMKHEGSNGTAGFGLEIMAGVNF